MVTSLAEGAWPPLWGVANCDGRRLGSVPLCGMGSRTLAWIGLEYPKAGVEVHASTPTMAASLGIHARTVGLTGRAMFGRPIAGPTAGNACRTRGIGAWGPVDFDATHTDTANRGGTRRAASGDGRKEQEARRATGGEQQGA